MAEMIILEFDGFSEAEYNKVNDILGVNMAKGEGDIPEGLLSHTAGTVDGGFVVIEVWDTKAHQEEFLTSRLRPALHEAGVTGPPRRSEWAKLHAHHTAHTHAAV